MLGVLLAYFALILGVLILWQEWTWLLFPFLIIGYSAVFIIMFRILRFWKDPFNPLSLILFLGLFRFSIPAFLLLFGVEPEIGIFELMGLSRKDWDLGHVLALTGIVGVIAGWFLAPGKLKKAKELDFQLSPGFRYGALAGMYGALAGMIAGFMALLLFVSSNAPTLDVVATGEFRGLTIKEGTGKFWYLGLMLIASSIAMSWYLLINRDVPKWTAFVPVIFAMASFWILGGRARALTPLAGGLLLLWYLKREKKASKRISFKLLLTYAIILAPFAIWILYFGQLYRGGFGIHGVTESLRPVGLWEYLKYAIFVDIGQLHALSGAVAIGAGVLGWQTFLSHLLWPLTEVVTLPGKSSGIFIMETLFGMGKRKWGFHPSLIGDVYLKLGLTGMPIVMPLFGILLKILYVKFRNGRLNSVVYVIAIVYSIRIFFESIDKWAEALTVLMFTQFIFLLSEVVSLQRTRIVRVHENRPSD